MNMRCIVVALALAGTPAFAQTAWPDKPVKLVVGFTAGSVDEISKVGLSFKRF